MSVTRLIVALFFAVFGATTASFADPDHRPVVAFVGTSSIAQWETLQDDFPSFKAVNFGVNGSAELPHGQMLSGVRALIVREVIPLRPSTVVIYAGENDLWVGRKPEDVISDLKAIIALLHKALPTARIVIISMKASPSRWFKISSPVVRTNLLLSLMVATDKRLRYASIFIEMFDHNGDPREDLYKDRLHMTPAGYDIWKKTVTPLLKQ